MSANLSAIASTNHLLAFIIDRGTQSLIETIFSGIEQSSHQVINGNIDSAVDYLKNNKSPNVLLLDVSDQKLIVSEISRLANVCEPGTRVIIIGQDKDLDLYRELKEMGIDDYLTKPINRDQLVHALGRATGKVTSVRKRSGKQIAITGCCGGSGVSTLTANIGRALAKHGAQTLITDLDSFGGDIDILLDSQSGFGLMNLLTDQQNIDKLLVERACQQVSQRLFLLKSHGQRQHFSPENYLKLRNALSRDFNYLLWDVPSHLLGEQGISDTLIGADIQVVICPATLAGVRQCKTLLTLLANKQQEQRLLLVLNHTQNERDIVLTQAEMEQSLGRSFDHVLPFAPKAINKASQLGQSLIDSPQAIGRHINKIAEDILGVTHTNSSNVLQRLGWKR